MAVTWQVTGDTPDQYDFTAAGNPVLGHQITFLTGEGNRGSVFIPQDHYNAGYVRAQVHAEASRADEINALTSEG